MPEGVPKRRDFLAQMALFRHLGEEELAEIAARLEAHHLAAGELLYAAGDRAENFYILASGQLQLRQPGVDAAEAVSIIEPGDSFGERALLDASPRQFSVSALRDSNLLYMPGADFDWMLGAHPEIAEKLETQSSGEELKRSVDFDWLREGELVHHVARKHSAYLWMRLAKPLFTAILAFVTFSSATNTPDPQDQFRWVVVGAGLLFVAIAWALWEFLDWRNDFYILTNLRVVWLEQILLRSSSRKEAPLASVQSVNIHTTLLGRLMKFGDVIVRTYTGTVPMPTVGEPHHIKHMIEEHVARLRQKSREEKHDSIRETVRESLGLEAPHATEALEGMPRPLERIERRKPFQLFTTRKVEGDVITYHKHWFVLFSSLLLPAFFLVALFFALQTLYGGLPPSPTDWAIAAVFIFLPLAVMVYRLLDWQNDIYRVTPDSLIDSEKKPLGSEVTKSAPLANVLSLENHRVGLLGLLLNFGVVRINVGDASLEFVDVHNPALIQQDIFLRMEALKLSRSEKQAEEDRQRMAEWLRIYDEERGDGQVQ